MFCRCFGFSHLPHASSLLSAPLQTHCNKAHLFISDKMMALAIFNAIVWSRKPKLQRQQRRKFDGDVLQKLITSLPFAESRFSIKLTNECALSTFNGTNGTHWKAFSIVWFFEFSFFVFWMYFPILQWKRFAFAGNCWVSRKPSNAVASSTQKKFKFQFPWNSLNCGILRALRIFCAHFCHSFWHFTKT